MMKYISLFSGIGGFDLALDRAGMTGDSVVEIDKNCQTVLRRHFPNSKLYDDVRKVGVATHERKSIDLICGGFPCQDVSIAGKRAGLAGERSGLWWEFARIIDELEPRWVIAENVPGLLSSNKGKDFAVIVRWLAERGYGVSWRILDAQYFGVPQRRRRVFIVASFGNGRSAEVLFEREGMSRDTPTRGEQGEVAAFSAGQGAKAGGIGYREEQSPTLKGTASGSNRVPAIVAGPLAYGQTNNHMDESQQTYIVEQNNAASTPDMISLRSNPAQPVICISSGQANAEIVKDGEPSLTRLHEQPIVFQQNARDEVRLMGGEGKYAGALSAQPGMKQQNYIAFDANRDGLTNDENISPTLKHQGDGEAAHGAYAKLSIAWEMSHASEAVRESGDIAPTLQQRMGTGGNQVPLVGVRRLTPTECERLQGFPDGWTDGQSDSTRYRQLGNAVAVPVVEWIGKRIHKVEFN